jgi:hypothetical protein
MRKGEAGDSDSKKKRRRRTRGRQGDRRIREEDRRKREETHLAMFLYSYIRHVRSATTRRTGEEPDLNRGRAREGGDHSGVKSGAHLKQHGGDKAEKAMGGGRRWWKHHEK